MYSRGSRSENTYVVSKTIHNKMRISTASVAFLACLFTQNEAGKLEEFVDMGFPDYLEVVLLVAIDSHVELIDRV